MCNLYLHVQLVRNKLKVLIQNGRDCIEAFCYLALNMSKSYLVKWYFLQCQIHSNDIFFHILHCNLLDITDLLWEVVTNTSVATTPTPGRHQTWPCMFYCFLNTAFLLFSHHSPHFVSHHSIRKIDLSAPHVPQP